MSRKRRRSDNTGSVFKDKYGYWNAQIAVGYTPSGRIRYKRKRAQTEAEVVTWLNAQMADQQQGRNIAPDKITVEQYLTRWLEQIEHANSYTTHKGYAQLCRDHIIPALGRLPLKKLTQAHVQEVLNRLHTAGKARNTIRNVKACLRKALNDAMDERIVNYNAAEKAKLPKVAKARKPKIQALTPEQARLLLAVVEPERLKALYWVALLLGLREGEILGLQLADIDLDSRTLHVTGAMQRQTGKGMVRVPTKTEASEAPVPIPDVLVPVLQAHLAMLEEERTYRKWKEHGLLFPSKVGTPISSRNLVRHFKSMLQRADLPDIRFHDLRHSCATLLISLKVHPRVVMEIMRHSQISTTMNIYGHAIPEVNREATNALGELIQPQELEVPTAPSPRSGKRRRGDEG
jgi:integrase